VTSSFTDLNEDHRLAGAVSLVALLQSAPDVTMKTLADPNPVHVHLDADLPKVTGAMADYNLLVLLVLDHDDHLNIPQSGAAGASKGPDEKGSAGIDRGLRSKRCRGAGGQLHRGAAMVARPYRPCR